MDHQKLTTASLQSAASAATIFQHASNATHKGTTVIDPETAEASIQYTSFDDLPALFDSLCEKFNATDIVDPSTRNEAIRTNMNRALDLMTEETNQKLDAIKTTLPKEKHAALESLREVLTGRLSQIKNKMRIQITLDKSDGEKTVGRNIIDAYKDVALSLEEAQIMRMFIDTARS